MHAVPIQMSAMDQMMVRPSTGTNKPPTIAARGIHHASRFVSGLLSQSNELWTGSLVISGQRAQQDDVLIRSERSAWIGGHGTEPYEQNTQQSPGFGRSIAPHAVHS